MSVPPNRTLAQVKQELKQLLVANLSLEGVKEADIQDDLPLFGDAGLGLDSLDGVELVVLLQRHYGLDVKDMQQAREVFRTIDTLAAYVLPRATK